MSLLSDFDGDVHKALKFAYGVIASEILAGSSIFAQMMSTGVRVQESRTGQKQGMSQHDRHAQAAMIIRSIEGLPEAQQAVITGWHDNIARPAAVAVLSRHIKGPDKFPQVLTNKLIEEWLDSTGKRYGWAINKMQRGMVERGEMPRAYSSQSLYQKRMYIYDQLDKLEAKAYDALRDHWSGN